MTILRPRTSAAVVAALAVLLTLLPGSPGEARGTAVPYLALGDSLPYGWDVVTQPPWSPPASHVGYPETLAARSPLEVTNAACPGETSGSFIDRVDDNGCGVVAANFGLKVDWGEGSQLDFATAFLQDNEDTGLVSIQLGANDLFLCQAGDDDDGDGLPECTLEEFEAVLAATAANLQRTLLALRGTEYSGPIVLVGYYALDYRDPASVAISQASLGVLQAIAGSGAFGDVVVADGFAAFEQASRRTGGDPCAAELLLPPLPTSSAPCDVHTTPDGDRVLAQAVRRAIDLGAIVSGNRAGR